MSRKFCYRCLGLHCCVLLVARANSKYQPIRMLPSTGAALTKAVKLCLLMSCDMLTGYRCIRHSRVVIWLTCFILLLAVITRPPESYSRLRRSLLGACGASPRYSSCNYPSSRRSFVSVRQVSPPPSSGRSLSSVRQVSLSRSGPCVS